MLEHLDESNLIKALGFRLPSKNLKEVITSLPNDPVKAKIFAHLQNFQPFDVSEFEKNITRFHKPGGHNNSKIRIEANKDRNTKTIFSDAINLNDLKPTEKAYYLAYNPDRMILSDLEANKLKSVSPQIIPKTNPLEEQYGDEKILEAKPNLDNIKPVSKESGEIDIENTQNQTYTQKSYCTCKRPYKEGELMIKCDYEQCEGWYHLECVGFKDKTEEEITKIKWYCSENCREKANRAATMVYRPIKKKNKGK